MSRDELKELLHEEWKHLVLWVGGWMLFGLVGMLLGLWLLG